MNIYSVLLNEQGYCGAFTTLDYLPDGYIRVSAPPIESNMGQKYDTESDCWVDEWDVTLIPESAIQSSEIEQRELDRDEMLLDTLIGQQQIILLIETGGDRL